MLRSRALLPLSPSSTSTSRLHLVELRGEATEHLKSFKRHVSLTILVAHLISPQHQAHELRDGAAQLRREAASAATIATRIGHTRCSSRNVATAQRYLQTRPSQGRNGHFSAPVASAFGSPFVPLFAHALLHESMAGVQSAGAMRAAPRRWPSSHGSHSLNCSCRSRPKRSTSQSHGHKRSSNAAPTPSQYSEHSGMSSQGVLSLEVSRTWRHFQSGSRLRVVATRPFGTTRMKSSHVNELGACRWRKSLRGLDSTVSSPTYSTESLFGGSKHGELPAIFLKRPG